MDISLRWTSLLVLGLGFVAGCGEDPVACLRTGDCRSTEICVDGVCTEVGARCDADEDCANGNRCDGDEVCSGGVCVRGVPQADGTECDADDSPASADFCLDELCVPSRCGDGVVDPAAGEVCDDANTENGDGCDDCAYSCTDDGDCDDSEECTGVETCDLDAHVCIPGEPLSEGADCLGAIGACMAGVCLPKSCEVAEDCDDGNLCTGTADCVDGECAAGVPLDCDDGSPCTEDQCRPADGCSNRLIDADFDGFSPSALGECGDDCDDENPAINPLAADGCDGVDNDCDGAIDEEEIVTYYADCDGDAFAAMDAPSVSACAVPSPALTGCTDGGMWTTRAPVDRTQADCNDDNASVFPGQTFQSSPIEGAPEDTDFDYNCDGVEEYDRMGVSTCGNNATCSILDWGYMGSVPPCGGSGVWMTCRRLSTICLNMPANTVARCR